MCVHARVVRLIDVPDTMCSKHVYVWRFSEIQSARHDQFSSLHKTRIFNFGYDNEEVLIEFPIDLKIES